MEWNGTNLFKGLKRTGAARFTERKSISEMSKYIGEKNSSEDKISLYDIYSLNAELEHSSYFHHMLELTENLDKKDVNEDGLDYIFLVYILTAFIETYDTI